MPGFTPINAALQEITFEPVSACEDEIRTLPAIPFAANSQRQNPLKDEHSGKANSNGNKRSAGTQKVPRLKKLRVHSTTKSLRPAKPFTLAVETTEKDLSRSCSQASNLHIYSKDEEVHTITMVSTDAHYKPMGAVRFNSNNDNINDRRLPPQGSSILRGDHRPPEELYHESNMQPFLNNTNQDMHAGQTHQSEKKEDQQIVSQVRAKEQDYSDVDQCGIIFSQFELPNRDNYANYSKVIKRSSSLSEQQHKLNRQEINTQQLLTPEQSDCTNHTTSPCRHHSISLVRYCSYDSCGSFSDIDEGAAQYLEDEVIKADKAAMSQAVAPLQPIKNNDSKVDVHEDKKGLNPEGEPILLGIFPHSPTASKSRSQSITDHYIARLNEARSKPDQPKPFVRKTFPSAVADRSPIFGVSSSLILRTCFRIGEALNVGAQSVRQNKPVLIELYGRVTSSQREEGLQSLSRDIYETPPQSIQHFVFKDLFHDREPFLQGDFHMWNRSQLWSIESRPFLDAGEGASSVMCRVVGRMKRNLNKWRLEVLSIWEATWEDVDFVASIYAKERS